MFKKHCEKTEGMQGMRERSLEWLPLRRPHLCSSQARTPLVLLRRELLLIVIDFGPYLNLCAVKMKTSSKYYCMMKMFCALKVFVAMDRAPRQNQ